MMALQFGWGEAERAPMDKTKRLIRWQRITIAVLIAGFSTAMRYAHTQKVEANLVTQFRNNSERAYQMQKTELEQVQDQHKNQVERDQQIIADLDQRLDKYKAKYGDIDASKKR